MEFTKKGFIPVMITPFRENGSLDFNGLTKLTEFYLQNDAAGLFANCLSSEMFELDNDERLALVKHVIKASAGRVPVVATGTFGGPIKKQAEFVRQMFNIGVDGVIVNTNMIVKETEPDEIFNERMFELLDLTGNIPMGFYECPVRYKRLISPNQLKLFAETGRLIYHKDTCCVIDLVKAKLDAIGGIQSFGLYDAYMVHAVESLKAGSAGLSCIQGNYWPELISWLCDKYNDVEYINEVRKIQAFLTSTMDVVHHTYPAASKYYLQKRGLTISSFTRQRRNRLTKAVKAEIDKLHTDYLQLIEEIKIPLEKLSLENNFY